MSNKTVIPGLENTSTPNQSAGPIPSSYASPNNGTVIPGIVPGKESGTQQVNSKPVIGFLYSVSKTGNGEFWPLHVGPNSIGRSQSCDICLAEATVSEQHAELVVRLMKNPEKVIASIFDQRSTCGTMINGESLGFEARECANGDIITIGEHYELYFILIDVKQLGLNVCPEFMPVRSGNMQQPQFSSPLPNDGRTKIMDNPFASTVNGTTPPPPFTSGRTFDADDNGGSYGQGSGGGRTIFM